MNFYGLSSSDQLDDARGRYPSDVTAYEAFEYKKKEYELDQMKDEKGNALILPDATALDMINILLNHESDPLSEVCENHSGLQYQ